MLKHGWNHIWSSCTIIPILTFFVFRWVLLHEVQAVAPLRMGTIFWSWNYDPKCMWRDKNLFNAHLVAQNLVLLHVISVSPCFSCAFLLSPFLQESPPFVAAEGGFTLPESSSTKVCHLRAGSGHNTVVDCIHWDAWGSHENTRREFTNTATDRTARTQEECTTQFCWRCFGTGTAFTHVGNWDQHYSRGMLLDTLAV